MAFDDPIPQADVYGITGTEAQIDGIRQLIWRLGGKIIVGGPYASLDPNRVMSWGAHLVVTGEAEEVIAETINQDGVIKAHRIRDLDSMPFPDRTQSHRYGLTIDGLPAATMITSRGCPYRCAFCSKPLGYKSVLRSVENIMAEVRMIEDLGFQAINFVDDSLGINSMRLLHLCQELGQEGITWRCLLRAEQVTEELAQTMKSAGCVEVGIGIESGSDRILRNIQKGETVKVIEGGILTLKRAGIRVKGFFIVGLPGEDGKSLAETEAFLERVALDDIDICILSIYRGSPIWNRPERYDVSWNGRPTYYKADPAKYDCGVSTSALSSNDLLEARAYLERRFKRWSVA
jgi:radical SAM superfamily enzyme YgiQ (UPF0313 family)